MIAYVEFAPLCRRLAVRLGICGYDLAEAWSHLNAAYRREAPDL